MENMQNVQNMKVSVIGGGVSGVSLARLAVKLGGDVLVSDAKKLPDGVYDELDRLGISHETGHELAFRADVILLSSGIAPSAPVVLRAEAEGVPVVGELEFVLPHLDGTIIGVTGTNGKSTVTTLIGHLLEGFSEPGRVAAGGNLGTGMADFACARGVYDYVVLELSSGQLHYLRQTNRANFRAAVITNLEPDHIDWHGSYEKYIEAKARVVALLGSSGRAFMRECDIPKINRFNPSTEKIVPLSWGGGEAPSLISEAPSLTRIDMRADRAVLTGGGGEKELFSYPDFPLIGKFNSENAAFGMAVLREILKSDYDHAEAVRRLSSYRGLPHRCEFVAERGGIRYIDDSKGTNVGAVVAALNSIDGNKIIILGGQGKGEDYAPLARSVKALAKHAIVLGSERDKILSALAEQNMTAVTPVGTISEAVAAAAALAVPGDIVLLSPACTSWDQYKNYGERGEHFRSAVLSMGSRA